MKLIIYFYKLKLNYFPKFLKNDEFVKILINSGIKIGENTIFYGPETMQIDRQRPYLLEIGSYCKITSGTIILTHDYSRSVLRRKYGEIIGEGKKTIIGNNVFIGMNSIILMGSRVGNNVIVGAGSVVNGIVPDNTVVAGNPARIIRTLDEHYKIRKEKTIIEAAECVNAFYDANSRYPSIQEIGQFWQLFMERNKDVVLNSGVNVNLNGDIKEEVIEDFLKTGQVFNGYDDFINYCKSNKL